MFETDREFFAWLAGWTEGEGCLTIRRERYKDVPDRFRAVLQISQMKPEPLLYIQERLGGKILKTASTGLHHWRIVGRKVIPVLEKIMPFMLIKQEQAKLLIELHELLTNYPAKRNGRPEEVATKLEQIKNQIHLLNARIKRRNTALSC